MNVRNSLKIINGQQADTMTIGDARLASLIVMVATMYASSIYTRYRVSKGKGPVLGAF